jgi:amino acid permease
LVAPAYDPDALLLHHSSCVLFNCIVSFLIAEAIPFFGNLVGLIGALLGALLSMYVPRSGYNPIPTHR